MIRASTTPSMPTTWLRICSAMARACPLVLAGDPDVDRRRLALVHRTADQAAGVEGEVQVSEPRVLGHPHADQVHVLLGRAGPCSGLSWTLMTASIGPALGV